MSTWLIEKQVVRKLWIYLNNPHAKEMFNVKIYKILKYIEIFSGSSDSKESSCNVGDLGLIPGLRRFPWRSVWQPTSVFLPGESPWMEESDGQKSMRSQRVWLDWVTKHIPKSYRWKDIIVIRRYLIGNV